MKPRQWPDNKRSFLGCNVAAQHILDGGIALPLQRPAG